MSYIPVLDFHPLGLPDLDGFQDKEWCTFSLNDSLLYLLNGNRYELADISEIGDDKLDGEIHFESEPACHAAMAEYYLLYNHTYPYLTEWRESIRTAHGVVMVHDDMESEPMEFE